MERLFFVLGIALATLLLGCHGGHPRMRQPGPTKLQQRAATQFDPYGDNEAGPTIVGGRPREFQRPFSEPVRAKNVDERRWPF
jgi:hypothetical protein